MKRFERTMRLMVMAAILVVLVIDVLIFAQWIFASVVRHLPFP
ncbi:MAG TPA: hypothetical protein VMU11_03975 [Verrucomicrobiae bacterium]|nr:hypothetical protein [Verrucomicrobiae bacterium]